MPIVVENAFLFTDIEGSTKLWERDARAMRAALARHDGVLTRAAESRNGRVFKTIGDAFCIVFDDAADALHAALDAQRKLLAGEWEGTGPIRVRMAIHTGEAEERGGDYFGSALSRVRRLLDAGHGGQILVSSAAREALDGAVSEGAEGVEVRDLGERRLRDIPGSEKIFQISAPGLPSAFPPLRTLDARAGSLPAWPTPLIGRESEAAAVAARMRGEARLLTLTGPGGTGKTRLALQIAQSLVDEFEDGVFFVSLASIGDSRLVVSQIAQSLGVAATGNTPLAERVKEYLRNKELLLVLDNFEHVLDAAALVSELLSACPKLKALATSRSALHLYGESEYPVPPLSLPDSDGLRLIEDLARYEAVRLFVERARAAKSGFELTNENAPAVADICIRLDGLPLAIELAAARIKLLPPQAMLERLGDRLKLLEGGARDMPERQRTLRGTMDWSHDLLDEGGRTLFRRLSVFAGGRTLEAIEKVCDPEGELDALDGIGSMVDKSLLTHEETDGEPRFVMLETIREYAREKLEESGEAEEVKQSHAGYFLALAEEAEPRLVGPDQVEWKGRLETEHDNLRAALSWSLGSGEAEAALRLAGALGWFWSICGHESEGRRWLEEALAKEGANPTVRAKALNSAGALAIDRGDLDQVVPLFEEGLALGRKAGDMRSIARSLTGLSCAEAYAGDLERGKALAEEAVAVSRELGDKQAIFWALTSLQDIRISQGDYEQVMASAEEAMTLSREIGDRQGVATGLNNLGYYALVWGDPERATAFFEETLALSRELGWRLMHCISLCNLGWARLLREEYEEAERLLGESLALSREAGDKVVTAECLEGLAGLAGTRNETMRATKLWGAAEALREATVPLSPDEQSLRDPYLAEARSQMREASWTEAWDEGRSMGLDEAVSLAMGGGEEGRGRIAG